MTIIPKNELTVEPLTKEEIAWLKKVEKILNQRPTKRLEFATGGDHDLAVYDKTHPNAGEFYDFSFEGANLADLSFFNGPNIVGMCK